MNRVSRNVVTLTSCLCISVIPWSWSW